MKRIAPMEYSAAILGPGSEVLGYDTEMSRDHDWSPRVHLFLKDAEPEQIQNTRFLLEQQLPDSFKGFPVYHQMTVMTTLDKYIEKCLAVNIREPLDYTDWLTFPSQTLLELTRGEVFRDEQGELRAIREILDYYPEDIWLYLMASTWQRIGQEEHLMLRAGFVEDELGSAIIASRIVRDIMNLCFLMERQYAPYPKWFGTAFKSLSCSESLMPHLREVQAVQTWREREHSLNLAFQYMAKLHNGLGITDEISEEATLFYDRPFKVMHGEVIASLITKQIKDKDIQWLSQHRLIGGIDQITDNTDFRQMCHWTDGSMARQNLKRFFGKGWIQ
ncbi:DUF4037 domain-containing protein [Paenibacillus sp. HJL G12]|uniref:DUF4037 domain-containing protein n=2 Tax=Paenibacillus dendrobii TaxID=2691084 RepID=A0A7X3IHD3_9BACL|nr:DUF4037 domain-containing protein [Paenibacillus dendrobii]MWV43336.1 DUF4037 domain-containing protein [Paenibacillus dendrobii]